MRDSREDEQEEDDDDGDDSAAEAANTSIVAKREKARGKNISFSFKTGV